MVDAPLTEAAGTTERNGAVEMPAQQSGTHRITVGADPLYDTRDFVADLRAQGDPDCRAERRMNPYPNPGSGFRTVRYESKYPNAPEDNRVALNAGRPLFATVLWPFQPVALVLSSRQRFGCSTSSAQIVIRVGNGDSRPEPAVPVIYGKVSDAPQPVTHHGRKRRSKPPSIVC